MFQTIQADADNPVKAVYLTDKTRNNQDSVIYKLNFEYSGDGYHIQNVYKEYPMGTRDFVTRIKRFMSRTKSTQKTINDNVDVNYSSGYIFEFVRKFRGHYEITDVVDEYTVGYLVASKHDIVKYFDRSRMSNGLVNKTHELMSDRLETMNAGYRVIY